MGRLGGSKLIKRVTGFVLFPQSFMLGFSWGEGTNLELFLGVVALSIEFK